MYFGNKGIHPSVLTIMERQGRSEVVKSVPPAPRSVIKKAGPGLVAEGMTSNGLKLVLEAQEPDLIAEVYIPVSKTQAFVLNEQDDYDLMQIDEGLGDLIKGAVGWMKWQWGNLKDFFKGKLPPGEERAFAKLYMKDPKVASEHFKKRLTDQGVDPQKVDQMTKTMRTKMERIVATRHGIKSKDSKSLIAMNDAHQAIQAAGPDKAAQMAAAKQAVTGPSSQILGGRAAPAKQGQPAQQNQQQAKPPAQQGQSAAQQPAAQPAAAAPKKTVDGKFADGDEVHAVDPKTQATHAGKVKVIDDKGNYVVVTGKDAKGGDTSQAGGAFDWKAGQAPAQPAQGAQPANPAQGTPGAANPPGPTGNGPATPSKTTPKVKGDAEFTIEATYKDPQGQEVPVSIPATGQQFMGFISQFKTGGVTGLAGDQPVEVTKMVGKGGGLTVTVTKDGGGQPASAAPAQPAGPGPAGLTPAETGATPAAKGKKPKAQQPIKPGAAQPNLVQAPSASKATP